MLSTNGGIKKESEWHSVTSDICCAMPFYVTEVGLFYTLNGYSIKRTNYESFLLMYTIDGKGELFTEKNSLTLQEGSLAIIDCDKYHYYRTADKNWDIYWVHIDGCGARMLYDLLCKTTGNSCVVTIDESGDVIDIFRKLMINSKKSDLVVQSDTSQMLHLLLNKMLNTSIHSIPNEVDYRKKDIEEAIEYIKKNYKEAISIDDILKVTCLSKYYFINLFRKFMGITPYQYLINYRINNSKILLRVTSKSVADIARENGFSDASNFTVQFKKIMGKKPLEYRKMFL